MDAQTIASATGSANLEKTIENVHRLALVRYFTKRDNEQHVTGMTRIYADSQKRAELVDVQSIVRYGVLINTGFPLELEKMLTTK
jgi:hypothetical protein